MKVFVGRSQSLWVCSRDGKVRRLPLSLTSVLLSTLLAVVLASISLSIIVHSGFNPNAWIDVFRQAITAEELEKQGGRLNHIIAKLQQEKDEARRLNTRLASKLQNLEGALGNVAGEVLADKDAANSKRKGRQDPLYKPASYQGSRLGLDQRMSIKQIDRLIFQLKHLPVRFPVSNPIITSGFGGRRSPHGIGSSFHHGVDFSLRESDRVFATGPGVVKKVGSMHGYGRYIDIEHQRGVSTRYAHLSRSFVQEGQKVAAGTYIAQGGSTGTSTGRHLHYEVLVKGRSRDPMLFLRLPRQLQFAMKSVKESVG